VGLGDGLGLAWRARAGMKCGAAVYRGGEWVESTKDFVYAGD
jgi:hypothetical protein